MRLIRSKGVGIYFISQNPLDVPESILAQLGNRIQHALRVYTPRETVAVKAAASTFRANPDFDTMKAISDIGTGEALVSTLEDKGVPSIVQRTTIRPPSSQIGPITSEERQNLIKTSPVSGKYDETVDRQSAYEMLQKNTQEKQSGNNQEEGGGFWDTIFGDDKKNSRGQSVAETAVKSITRTAANSIGRSLAKAGEKYLRGVLGNLLGGGRK